MKTVWLALLVPALALAQREYRFDYMLQYNYRENAQSEPETRYWLTNSKDNSYLLQAAVHDDTVSLRLIDQKGADAQQSVSKEIFFSGQPVDFSCSEVSHLGRPAHYETHRFAFVRLKDTVIDGENCQAYQLRTINRYWRRGKKSESYTYIVEPGTGFHLPVFDFQVPYEEWRTQHVFRTGIARIMFQSPSGRTFRWHQYELVRYQKIDRRALVPSCDNNNP